MDEFAERVKRLREHQGLTRRELAHRSGLHEQHLLKIEQGLRRRLEADTIIRLAKTLGVTTDYLLGMTDVNPTTAAGHTGAEGVRNTEALDAEALEAMPLVPETASAALLRQTEKSPTPVTVAPPSEALPSVVPGPDFNPLVYWLQPPRVCGHASHGAAGNLVKRSTGKCKLCEEEKAAQKKAATRPAPVA